MTGPEQHDDVGSAAFQFGHRRGGSLTRFCFNMKVGDNPNFWKARLLMHGAEFHGIIHGVIEVDDGALKMADEFEFDAHLHVGGSRFSIKLFAPTREDAQVMCREIGGFHLPCEPDLTLQQKAGCALRWLWERRPVIRWRSPLDVFN